MLALILISFVQESDSIIIVKQKQVVTDTVVVKKRLKQIPEFKKDTLFFQEIKQSISKLDSIILEKKKKKDGNK